MTALSRAAALLLQFPGATTRNVSVDRDLHVPMPDGVELLADRYAPKRGGAELPLLLVRSPYGRRDASGLMFGLVFGRLFAERGFQVVVQSCRGTFGSGGVFDPFSEVEGDDGHATLEWLRRQPWYPGEFGMVGPSYLGYTQWALARDAGSELRSMAVSVGTSDFRESMYPGGSFALEALANWILLLGKVEDRFSLIRQQLATLRVRRALRALPIGELDERVTGQRLEYFQHWLDDNDPEGAYWKRRQFADVPAKTTADVCFVGGWYDMYLPAQLRDYEAMAELGRRPRLVIGPWRHLQAIPRGARESLAWQRSKLGGVDGEHVDACANVFVSGLKRWVQLESWPPQSRMERWYLHSDQKLDVADASGGEPDEFVFDPASPTPNLGGPLAVIGRSRVDNRKLERRPDVLIYTSSPLGSDVDLGGRVEAELFVSSDSREFDVFVRLCDVASSGRSVNVCDWLERICADDFEVDEFGVLRVQVALWPAAHRFRQGHRLRLQVSSGAFPRFVRNLGTAEPLRSATTLAKSHQTLHHDERYPSSITLPVCDFSGAQKEKEDKACE